MCRQTINFSQMSATPSSTSGFISSKIQSELAEIIIIIKDMDILKNEGDQAELNRLLYRSMDSLTVLKCQLLQHQVSTHLKPTCLKRIQELEDRITTARPTSEKTSSSTSILGKKRSRPVSPVALTPEQSTSSSTQMETQVNLPSASTCAGITKYPCWDGEKQATYYTSCQNSLTNLHTYLTSHDQNLKTGQKTTRPLQWKALKTDYSSTPNTNAPKL